MENPNKPADSVSIPHGAEQVPPTTPKKTTAEEEYSPEKEYEYILSQGPIIIFSKSYCPHSKFAKQLLLVDYEITPEPLVVELDLHPHGSQLQSYIGDITGRRTVPNIHIQGISRGGADEFRALKSHNNVEPTILEWGKAQNKQLKTKFPKITIKKNAPIVDV